MKKTSNVNKAKEKSKISIIKHKIEIKKKDQSSSYDKCKKGTSKLNPVKPNFKRIYSSSKNQKKIISINSSHDKKNKIIVNKINKNLSGIIKKENSSLEDDFTKISKNILKNENNMLIKLGSESLISDIQTNNLFNLL